MFYHLVVIIDVMTHFLSGLKDVSLSSMSYHCHSAVTLGTALPLICQIVGPFPGVMKTWTTITLAVIYTF